MRIAPVFGGINLEDISAPRCFEVEERLIEALDIPVMHDDQHGTAVVILAAIINAAAVVGKRLEDMTIVLNGSGAAGTATIKMLLAAGVRDVIAVDRDGAITRDEHYDKPHWRWLAENTNPHQPPRPAARRAARRRRLHRRERPEHPRPRGHQGDGARSDRLRDGQPDARRSCPTSPRRTSR